MEKMFGYTRDEYEGKSTRMLYPTEEEYKRVGELVYENAKKLVPVELNAVFRRKNGQIFYGHYKLKFINPKDPSQGLITSILDIDDLVRTEKELKHRNKALESSVDGIAILDKNLQFSFVNKAYANIFGFNAQAEMLGRSWRLLFDEYESKRFEELIKPEFDEKGFWRGEAKGLKKDKSTFPIELTLTALENNNMISVIRDISERKNAEEIIRQSNAKTDFLLRVAHDLINFNTKDEVFKFVARNVYKLIGQRGMVTIIQFGKYDNTWSVKYVEGIGKLARKIEQLLGFGIHNMKGKVKTRFYHNLERGRLSRIDFDFPAFTSGKINNIQGKALKKLLGTKSIYAVPFIRNEEVLGAVNIAYKENEIKDNIDLIEALIAEASIAIDKVTAQEELAENLKEKEIISKNVPNILWKADIHKDGKISNTYFSDVVDEFLDLPEGSIANDWNRFFSYIKPKYLPKVKNMIRQGIQKPGITLSAEYEVITAKNKVLWFLSSGRGYAEGNVVRVYGYTANITERKKAAQELAENEQILNLIFNTVPDPITIIRSKDGLCLNVNEGFSKLTGYLKEETIGHVHSDLNLWVYPEHRKAMMNELLEKGSAESIETVFRRKDGKFITGLMSARFIKIKGEDCIITVTRDITERKKAEMAIRESEEKYHNIFLNAPIGIFHYDEQGVITDCNEPFVEIIGSSKRMLLGLNMINKLQNQKIIDCVKTSLKDGKAFFEDWYSSITANKKTFVKILFQGLKDHKGRITSGIGLVEDVTARKIAEKDLLSAKEKAEQSDRLKTAFLATMSHELRTPLNAIIGFSDLLLLNEKVMNEAADFVESINTSGKHLLDIIKDLFDISTLETGESKVKKSSFTTSALFYEIDKSVKDEIVKQEKKHLDIRIKLPENAKNITLNQDKNKLKRVLINLINNAVKFTREGYVEYGFRPDNRDVVFYVKDTGIGIAKDKQQIIFERFRQVEESDSTRQFSGIGLGLSICQKIADLLDGEIWLDSELGKGSTFYFRLRNVLEKPISEKPEKKQAIEESDNRLKGKLILIVDDEDSNRLLLQTIIKRMGGNTLDARNGKEALEVFKDNPDIKLVLMDIKMPVMNGYEATEEILKLKPEMPIVALTAFAFESDKKSAFDAGCVDYLSKPVSINELRGKMKKWVED